VLDPKNDWHLFDGFDELYRHAKFGEDRTTAVDSKIWCLYVCHAPRVVRFSFEGCILCRGLWVDFDSVYIAFFSSDCPFRRIR